jgi:hypothetical protein
MKGQSKAELRVRRAQAGIIVPNAHYRGEGDRHTAIIQCALTRQA